LSLLDDGWWALSLLVQVHFQGINVDLSQKAWKHLAKASLLANFSPRLQLAKPFLYNIQENWQWGEKWINLKINSWGIFEYGLDCR